MSDRGVIFLRFSIMGDEGKNSRMSLLILLFLHLFRFRFFFWLSIELCVIVCYDELSE